MLAGRRVPYPATEDPRSDETNSRHHAAPVCHCEECTDEASSAMARDPLELASLLRAAHTGGQRTGQDRTHAKRHDFMPPLGHHRAEAADHDPETAEIGETAQRVSQDHACAR